MTNAVYFDYDRLEPSVDTYFDDISNLGLSLLTFEQEQALAQRIEAGDKKARETLILANLKLVVHVAAKYHTDHLTQQDLVQEGNIGLMRAIEDFDWRRGLKFSTYATYWIRQGITRAISEKERIIDVPVHISDDLKKMKKTQQLLAMRLERIPTRAELAQECGWTIEYIDRLRNACFHVFSLDRPLEENNDKGADEIMLHDSIMDPQDQYEELEDSELSSDMLAALERVMAALPQRTQDMLRHRLSLNCEHQSLQAIADRWHVSRERVRQIEAFNMPKIQRALQQWRQEVAS